MRNIVLVQPPLPANERHKKVLPLGLAYLASYLRRRDPGISIRILDAQAGNMDVARTMAALSRCVGDGDCVGITYWTCQALYAYEISDRLRKGIKDLFIVHGGIHCTIFPEEALAHADCCVLHEGEVTFAELVSRLKTGADFRGIEGIAYKDKDRIAITEPRDFIENLDLLPLPAWDLLDIKRYDTPLHVVGGNRLPIMGSRGCPYACSFCGSPLMWKRRLRWRSPGNIVMEMKAAIADTGISQFHFWDDNIMIKRGHVEELCKLIISEGLKIKWTGLSRASHIAQNADLLEIMSEAGCIGLEVGIESANPDTFNSIGKKEELKVIENVARFHKAHGMNPMFTFMAFNPGETISSYYEQARFIDGLIKDIPWYSHFHMLPFPLYVGQFCTPHPGTELHREAPLLGELLAGGWEDYYHHQINFVPGTLLEDVPEKNTEINSFYMKLCVLALQTAFWTDFSDARSITSRMATLKRYARFILLFWLLCNGKRTVRAICYNARALLGLDGKEALRFGAFTCLVLGQIGAIKSAVHDRGRRREIVHVVSEDALPPVDASLATKYGLFIARRMDQGMRAAGKFFRRG